jgi:hypothetical protein
MPPWPTSRPPSRTSSSSPPVRANANEQSHTLTVCTYHCIYLHVLTVLCFYFCCSAEMRLSCGVSDLSCGLVADLLEEEDVVAVNFDVVGGMRGKWRKKRMRRLRRKRRKMRQRAR